MPPYLVSRLSRRCSRKTCLYSSRFFMDFLIHFMCRRHAVSVSSAKYMKQSRRFCVQKSPYECCLVRDVARLMFTPGTFTETLNSFGWFGWCSSPSPMLWKLRRRKQGTHLMASIFTRHFVHVLYCSAMARLSCVSNLTSMHIEISLWSILRQLRGFS